MLKIGDIVLFTGCPADLLTEALPKDELTALSNPLTVTQLITTPLDTNPNFQSVFVKELPYIFPEDLLKHADKE